jgi:murein DD-endopeptidase MepM/ murein hydrolase activator NlpD
LFTAGAGATPGTEETAPAPAELAAAPALPATPAPALAPNPARPPSNVEQLLAEIDREERGLKKQLDELVKEAERTHARTLVRGRSYARLARAGLLPIGSGFDRLVDHATRLERLRRALARDLELDQQLLRRRVAIGKRIEELRTRRGPLDVEQQAIARASSAVLAEQDRKLAFERAFGGLGGPSGHTAVYGAGVGPADPSELSRGFASMKGRLPFPITGRSEIHSAHRADGPGLEMRAPRGTPVRAVYPGRVSFADRYSDYGLTVIVEHGDRHYTVSANLEDVAVRVGDEVSAGSRLASVGDSGSGMMLYFEIRIGTDPVDPAEWFGI